MNATLPEELGRRGRSPDAVPTVNGSWYALWTHSHCERLVRDRIEAQGFHTFLPESEVWSSRRGRPQWTRAPLFPGYIFLRHVMDKHSYIAVSKVRGLVRILGGPWDRLAAVPAREVESLQKVVAAQVHSLPYPYLEEGERVRVCRGPLAGVEGFLVRSRPERALLVLSVELFCRSVSVEIDSALVAKD